MYVHVHRHVYIHMCSHTLVCVSRTVYISNTRCEYSDAILVFIGEVKKKKKQGKVKKMEALSVRRKKK